MSFDQAIDVRVTDIEAVTPLIKRFTFEALNGDALPAFSGGAHIVVEMSDGERIHRNPYSLIGSPWDNGRYRIAVRRSEGGRGGSRYMHEKVAPGARLRISPPVNLFPLIKTRNKHVLIAGGVGITPFFAHLAELRAMDVPHELHYAVRSREHAAFADELAGMIGDRLRLYCSEEGQRIDFGALLARQPLGTDVYVCGPEGMVEATFAAARAAGWPESHVHAEQFASPPSGEPFEAVLANSGITVQVGAETSLLEAIEAAGVDAPCLCRGGVCGQCALDVIECEGELVHHDHYLSPEERKSNTKLMPCVSRARGGRVVLAL